MWERALLSYCLNQADATQHIVRFTQRQYYQRFRAFCEQVSKIRCQWLPSIHGVRLPMVNAERVARQFSDWIMCERDKAVRLPTTFRLAEQVSGVKAELEAPKKYLPWGIEAVQASALWRYTYGEGVQIAVIDTGVDRTHRDLVDSVTYADMDDNGHGTHISGTIAGSHRGGLPGIAPGSTLYGVKAFDHLGAAYVSDIVKAIAWCMDRNIHLINMSFGMQDHSPALYNAVKQAVTAGAVVVSSVGNGDVRELPDYPARYPEVLSVGALSKSRQIAAFSRGGREADMFAPGMQIVSSWLGGRYKSLDGTSMATAHVTGILALLWSIRKEWAGSELLTRLLKRQRGRPVNGERALAAI